MPPRPLVIFLSAVSSEFHSPRNSIGIRFKSYRDALAESLRKAGLQYQVIVQEDLAQGYGGLLETLENEISSSALLIHLAGFASGEKPKIPDVRQLRERHPNLLKNSPEIIASMEPLEDISFTQWEYYLALHFKIKRLAFILGDEAERVPGFSVTKDEQESQLRHIERLREMEHYDESIENSRDLTIKVYESILRNGLSQPNRLAKPASHLIEIAIEQIGTILAIIRNAIKNPDRESVPDPDSAGLADYAAGIEIAAIRYDLDTQSLIEVLDNHEDNLLRELDSNRTAESLYDIAFNYLARANYPKAIKFARQASDTALLKLSTHSDPTSKQTAIDSLQLLAEALISRGKHTDALDALEEAGQLIDQNTHPLEWAAFHKSLANQYLEIRMLGRAKELLLGIEGETEELDIDGVLDIHEKEYGTPDSMNEQSVELASTLLTIFELYYIRATGNDLNIAMVYLQRAERILRNQRIKDNEALAFTLIRKAKLKQALNATTEAVDTQREAISLFKSIYSSNNIVVQIAQLQLGHYLSKSVGRDEAYDISSNAQKVLADPTLLVNPKTAYAYGSLGELLYELGDYLRGVHYLQKCLDIRLKTIGNNHPDTTQTQTNLGIALGCVGKQHEAEPLLRQAINTRIKLFGVEHPYTAQSQIHLGVLLDNSGKQHEAEPLLRQALNTRIKLFGIVHTDTAQTQNNLGVLLDNLGKQHEAEPLLRQALDTCIKLSGIQHPQTARFKANLGWALKKKVESEGGSDFTEVLDLFENALPILSAANSNYKNVADNIRTYLDTHNL